MERKKGLLRKLVISRRISTGTDIVRKIRLFVEEAREQEAELLKNKTEKTKALSKLELRNFKEGRYEDVMKHFQLKAARRRGVVPGKLKKKKSKFT